MRDDRTLLAVETGGSSGRAALVLEGRIARRSLEEGLNPNDVGLDLFEQGLRELCLPLISPLLVPRSGNPPLDAVAGVAGAGDPMMMKHCKRILELVLKPYGSRLRLQAMTDAGALAWACIGDDSGMVLIAGTGSICIGVGKQGGRQVSWRAGGEGSFRDKGSGSVLGMHVLNAAIDTVGRGFGQKLLVKLICERHGIEPGEIRSHFLPPDRSIVADLARMAFEASELGDETAKTMVRDSARDLVGLVEEVKTSGGFSEGTEVFVSGGLFNHPMMRRDFSACIEVRIPGIRLKFIEDSLMEILGGLMKRGSGREL